MCLIEKYHYWIFKEMKGEKQSTLKSSLQLGNGNALEGKVVGHSTFSINRKFENPYVTIKPRTSDPLKGIKSAGPQKII